MRAEDYYPGFKRGMRWGPDDVIAGPVSKGDIWYVDGDKSAGGAGQSWDDAFATIGAAVSAASKNDVIYVAPLLWGAVQTDPNSYDETFTIPLAKSNLSIIGTGTGRTQGGLPQMKIGSGSTAMITIEAPGCTIRNMGINGYGSTGGGILMDCDSGATKTAFGTSIINCHIKNCVGSTATNAATGGGIMWSANGGSWQVHIAGNKFYKNVGDVVLMGTSESVPQDVLVEWNTFSGPAGSVDCNIYTGGSGMNGLYIEHNTFPCFPGIGSGTNAKPLHLTGSVGILSDNDFGFVAQGTGAKTFGASGDVIVPTTMFMVGNRGETDTDGDPGIFFRT